MKCFCSIAFAACLVVSIARADTLFDNGSPSLADAHEMTHWRQAERFTVTGPVILESVRFWEIQARAESFAGSFIWEIRSHSATNSPGVILFTGDSTNLIRFATGRAYFVIYPEFENTFDFPAISLPAGTYWLVLHNGPLSNNVTRDIFWETAVNVSPEPSQRQEAPYTAAWRGNGALSKLAFQLFGVPQAAEPRITAIQRVDRVPQIKFTTAAGRNYRVEYKNSLVENAWSQLPGAESVAGTGGEVQVIDSDPASRDLPQRFYRVEMLSASRPRAVLPPGAPAELEAVSTDASESSLRFRLAQEAGR